MEETRDEKVVRMYREGTAQHRIAKELGIGRTVVRNILKVHQVPLRKYTTRPREPSERDLTIAKLYWENYDKRLNEEGRLSPREIGEMYGLTRQAVVHIANGEAGQKWKPETSKSANPYGRRNGGRSLK